jgi:hypothetical protein
VAVDVQKAWLDTRDDPKYGMVAVVGNLLRAKIEPRVYTADDLKRVDSYLKSGGTLLVMLSARDMFRTAEGKVYLDEVAGVGPVVKAPKVLLREPVHPWVKHLGGEAPWLGRTFPQEHLLRALKGERIIGSPEGATLLFRQHVGKGQLIYVGWELHESLPATRSVVPTLAQEKSFEDQLRILTNIVGEAYPGR